MTFLASSLRRLRKLTALAVLGVSFATTPALAADLGSMIPSPPSLAAKAWVLMDAKSGRILVENNADERVPPASLTKMMTAYIAEYEMDKGNLAPDDQVRISENAWRTGGSRMFLRVGTYASVNDLMQGIVIQSGNDASVAMSEHIAGSEDAFAQLMNQHAKMMGLKNTHFMNPTGLPNPDHYSSAHDLAIIARHIIEDYPGHYKLYSEKYFTYNDIRQPNRNLLLWRDKTVDGLKTGHTEEAGYCLVASAKQEDTRLIAVVLGTNSEEARAQETQKLLSYGFRYYKSQKLYDKGAVLNEARVWGGAQNQVKLGVDHEVYLTVPSQNDDQLAARMNVQQNLEAPIEAGKQYGTLQVVQGDEVIHEEPLVALEAVEQGGFFKRIWDSVQKFVYGLFE
ncbi:D-alanyl-D-alanine carboxypeptidase family protein [Phytohalomonas tamaricis]|uniref:D-alanyl-D-alanine carboxypeptidase family protein n=1 Tax=Phytohalomonas tamaricis TaxID=2081032 RepID=UPI000D0BDBE3|nr:D-alanyl-D-alanine carboxypeptidase family protein [Phytohalomonas tamaricis]